MPSPTPCRRGFTLIELLVVIGIISLLISMTFPSLGRAREQARSTHCMTRLSELMKATTMYSHDNQFMLPRMQYAVQRPTSDPCVGGVYHGWAELLYEYVYSDDDYSLDHDYPVMHNREDRFELWTCLEALPRNDSTGHYRVYQYAWSKGTLDHVKHRIPLITDANPQVTDQCDLRRADIPNLHIAGLQPEAFIDERHYAGANYAFNDGHVERRTGLKEELALDWDLDPDTPNE